MLNQIILSFFHPFVFKIISLLNFKFDYNIISLYYSLTIRLNEIFFENSFFFKHFFSVLIAFFFKSF